MAAGTTLLSYEMSWQLKLFELMTNSQQAGDYIMACQYGIAFYRILGINEVPEKRIPEKGGGAYEMQTWKEYFITLMLGGVSKVGETITNVRNNYAKKQDIPDYKKPREAVVQ